MVEEAAVESAKRSSDDGGRPAGRGAREAEPRLRALPGTPGRRPPPELARRSPLGEKPAGSARERALKSPPALAEGKWVEPRWPPVPLGRGASVFTARRDLRMDRVTVRFPDGSARTYSRGTTLAEVARDVGATAALAARVNGVERDLSTPVEDDVEVEWLTFADPAGRAVYWHSTAHLLAQAVRDLFPGVKLAIGPPIEDGFYYDFDIGRPFTAEDLERIEARMRDLAARDQRIERVYLPRAEAARLFHEAGEIYKAELLEGIPDDPVSFYRQDGFQD